MSLFLCIAVPRPISSRLSVYFDSRVHFSDAATAPIGRQACGDCREFAASLVQIGFSSESLIGRAGNRRTRNNDHRGILVAGVRAILDDNPGCGVALLAHTMTGYIAEETVTVREHIRLDMDAWMQLSGDLEEDVRYVVTHKPRQSARKTDELPFDLRSSRRDGEMPGRGPLRSIREADRRVGRGWGPAKRRRMGTRRRSRRLRVRSDLAASSLRQGLCRRRVAGRRAGEGSRRNLDGAVAARYIE